ncbi:hypothetical protein GCM10028868_07620 [Virgibacillus kimchii]
MDGFQRMLENIEKLPQDWEEHQIPAAAWAVFPVHGAMPDAMPKVWKRIFSEWFPATGYEHAGGPEMEIYPTDADPSTEDYYSEIWIPIKNMKANTWTFCSCAYFL